MDAPYARLEQVAPGIARVLAHNPSAFTYYGTQTYLLGTDELAVIDPGPNLPEHVDALVNAIGGRPVGAIVCTHTHRDHSPAAEPLRALTGAPVVGCAPLVMDGTGLEAGFDATYRPDRVLDDGEKIEFDGQALIAVATPGHTSNHLCFALGDALFSGDHVMGWSTTVVVPPDGDMAQYMASLHKLRGRGDRLYYPAHGPAIANPQQYVRHLIGHRMQREKQILRTVGDAPASIPEIVAAAYPELDPKLTGAAKASVHAHLLDLQGRGAVRLLQDGGGQVWTIR